MDYVDLFEKLLRDFFVLWATIDPIGTLSVFLGVTGQCDLAEKRKIALRAVAYSAIILIAFMMGGQFLLSAMDIHLASFQIAGGVMLFIFGLQMTLGIGMGPSSYKAEKGHDLAVFPLAIPSIASPGAIMAVVLLTDNSLFPVATQVGTGAVMMLVLVVTLLFLLAAPRIHRVLGRNGSIIIIRVMGMLLCALAVEMVFQGIANLDKLPH